MTTDHITFNDNAEMGEAPTDHGDQANGIAWSQVLHWNLSSKSASGQISFRLVGISRSNVRLACLCFILLCFCILWGP